MGRTAEARGGGFSDDRNTGNDGLRGLALGGDARGDNLKRMLVDLRHGLRASPQILPVWEKDLALGSR